MRNISKYLAIYTSGAKPLLVENDTFITEIPLAFHSMSSFSQNLMAWFDFQGETASQIKEHLNQIGLPTGHQFDTWESLVLYLVPGWHRIGTRLKPLKWPKNQIVNIEEIKQVPGWQQNGTRLLKPKIVYVLKILLLALSPSTLQDLMHNINYANRGTFRNIYLNPLQDIGFVAKTEAHAISSPEQKYVTTEAGRRFLSAQ